MEVTPGILTTFLDEKFDNIIKHDPEWIIPSIANPSKMKLYVNIEKATAIDFIGNKGYNGRTLIGAVMGIDDKDELDSFIMDYVMRHIRNMDLSEFNKSRKPVKPKPPPPVQRIPLPEGCIDILGNTFYAKQARAYLAKRGIGPGEIEKYHLTSCTQGRFKQRIIIPFIEKNEIVWFQGRAMLDSQFLRYDNPEGVEKSMIVYNIDAIKKVAIITEGPFDAMTVDGQAIMGSALSDWQAMKIVARKPEKIILVPDNDFNKKLGLSPGYVGAMRSIEKLLDNKVSLSNILIAEAEGGKDMNALGRKKAMETIAAAAPFTFSTYLKFKKMGAKSERVEKLV